jgi:hypothetical protein
MIGQLSRWLSHLSRIQFSFHGVLGLRAFPSPQERPATVVLPQKVKTIAILLLKINRRGVFFLLILRRNKQAYGGQAG